MMNELLMQLATSGGPTGVVLVLSYLYVRTLHNALREVEDKRVEDQKAMVNKLLQLNDNWLETLNAHAETAQGQKLVLSDLKQLLFAENLRKR